MIYAKKVTNVLVEISYTFFAWNYYLLENIVYICSRNKLRNKKMEAICGLKDVYKVLYQFERQFQVSHEMTINEAMLMCCLQDGDGKSAGALCEYIGLSPSRVSKIINSVEKMGYIERSISSEDKRQMLFSLTTSGWRKITEKRKIELHIPELYAQLKSCFEKG